jgi:hypothetical protein
MISPSNSRIGAYREGLIDAYSRGIPLGGHYPTVVEPPAAISSVEEYVDFLHWFAEEVMPAVP